MTVKIQNHNCVHVHVYIIISTNMYSHIFILLTIVDFHIAILRQRVETGSVRDKEISILFIQM
jgi:hypothetical protein